MLDDDGHFHVTDAPIDLSRLRCSRTGSRSASSGCSALCVFYQFFTRYVLNDSAAWTEEIARYLLICIGVRRHRGGGARATRHIHVDFLYRLIAGQRRPRAVDAGRHPAHRVLRRSRSWLTIADDERMGNLQMTIIDLPMNIVYGFCAVRLRVLPRSARSRSRSRTGGAAAACSSGPSIAIEETIA